MKYSVTGEEEKRMVQGIRKEQIYVSGVRRKEERPDSDKFDFNKDGVDEEVGNAVKSIAMQYANSNSVPTLVELEKDAEVIPGKHNDVFIKLHGKSDTLPKNPKHLNKEKTEEVIYSCVIEQDRQTVSMSGHLHGFRGEHACLFDQTVIGKLPEKVVFSGLVDYCGHGEYSDVFSFKSTAIKSLREQIIELEKE